MSPQRVIALLGRKDEPTDAVEEYCRYLAAALGVHSIQLEPLRFPCEEMGWGRALTQLGKSVREARGHWVLLQYTALAWSRRGFPQNVLRVIRLLQSRGLRVAIVFHDVEPYPGSRLIDRFRRRVQVRTMREALRRAELAIFTVPPANLSWLSRVPANAKFIPVGANLPIPSTLPPPGKNAARTIGVFSITGGQAGARETALIVAAVRHASQRLGELRLSVFGRHAEVREAELRQGLQNSPVQLSVEGVVEPDQVVSRLLASDVLLFVRGPISSRRSSAIAAIACGLPVIAFAGSETAAPITDAGVILIPAGQSSSLNDALVRVLSDAGLREQLGSRSRAAAENYFCWPAVAARFAALLDDRGDPAGRVQVPPVTPAGD